MKEIYKRISLLIFFVAIISTINYAQVETVPADQEIYYFLKKLQVKGAIENYNDIILPLSKSYLTSIVESINKLKLNSLELSYLDKLKKKYLSFDTQPSIFESFPSNVFADNNSHLYRYKDSAINFTLDPYFYSQSIYSANNGGKAGLIDFGGRVSGTYKNLFGFKLTGSNGFVLGDRNTAILNRTIEQSFTFNDTKMNYFDNTEGYIRIANENLSLQLGRERVIWGNGYLDKITLGLNPPKFDFVKFDFTYKNLSYNFLHGWLIRKPIYTPTDSLVTKIERKPEKYIAISRIGYNTSKFNIGVSQTIIYSDRSFEAAYLNPFLFWESAQRSLNDVDNSFLSIDGRFRVFNGIELSISSIIDDIDFGKISKGEWFDNSHGLVLQSAIFLTDPILPENTDFIVEYTLLRPYTFSHPGYYDQLTYTNNGYMLGAPLEPNSTKINSLIRYRFSPSINGGFGYSLVKHGKNILDENGKLVKTVGGDVYRFLTIDDEQSVYLLKGDLETTNNYTFFIIYEPFIGYIFRLDFNHINYSSKGRSKANSNLFLTFYIDIN